MERLLDTLTVVEASRGVAVRYCGRLFAQLGATVVRAPGGDDTKIGYAGEAGQAYGRWLDAGKLEAAPDGAVDLVIGGQDAAGVAAGEAIAAKLPGSPTVLAIRWFHADGPYADWRAATRSCTRSPAWPIPSAPSRGPRRWPRGMRRRSPPGSPASTPPSAP